MSEIWKWLPLIVMIRGALMLLVPGITITILAILLRLLTGQTSLESLEAFGAKFRFITGAMQERIKLLEDQVNELKQLVAGVREALTITVGALEPTKERDDDENRSPGQGQGNPGGDAPTSRAP